MAVSICRVYASFQGGLVWFVRGYGKLQGCASDSEQCVGPSFRQVQPVRHESSLVVGRFLGLVVLFIFDGRGPRVAKTRCWASMRSRFPCLDIIFTGHGTDCTA